MRRKRAIATIATTALAILFSVQQGEHGPLVVYKLEVPAQAVAAPPSQDAGRLAGPAGEPSAGPLSVIPSRAPHVLGRVTVTPEPPATPALRAASGVSVLDVLQGLTRAAASRHAEPAPALDWDGEGITLERVNADISWRRETADKLRRLPFSPRF